MRKQIAAIALTLGILVPVVGNAQGLYGNDRSVLGQNKVYLGVKYGIMVVEPDVSGADDIEMDNMGLVFGGHINDYVALELDYTTTVSAEKEEFLGRDVKFETDTLGLFLVGKTTGTAYVRGRVGYAIIDQDVSSIGSDSVYGLAFGLGAGFEFSDNAAVEIEYTLFPETDEFDRLGKIIDDTISTEFISIGLVFSYD